MWFTRFSPGCNSENWHEDRTGLAGSSLAVLGVTQSVAMAHTSVHNKHLFPEVLLEEGVFHKLHLSQSSFPRILVCSSAKLGSGRIGLFEA